MIRTAAQADVRGSMDGRVAVAWYPRLDVGYHCASSCPVLCVCRFTGRCQLRQWRMARTASAELPVPEGIAIALPARPVAWRRPAG